MQANEAEVVKTHSGWSSSLARFTGGVLLFELISGLAITVGPFHPANQWNLLLHTTVGILTLLPVTWYFVRHWQEYSSQAISDVKLLGYVAIVAVAVCAVSGLVVTYQGLFALRTTPWMRYLHLISTVVVVLTTVPHLVLAWLRRKRSEVVRAAGSWMGASGATAIVGLLLVIGLTGAYSGTKYRNQFPSDYRYVYGANRPFAPSLAHTSTNGAFDPRSISGSETCGSSGCHTQIYREWRSSAHRYAAMDPLFQAIQSVMAKQNGPESTRYCGGCHDPISLFSGTKNLFVSNLTALQGYQEGISCLVCHSIHKTDIQGNANYTLVQPDEYLWQWAPEHSAGAAARNFLIRTWPAHHNLLSKRMFKKPEYCAACHKQFIDQEVNRVGWVQLQNQYDNWAASHWNHKGDARTTVECRECHMPLSDSTDPASGDPDDYNRSTDDHKHRSHRFLAANSFVPALLHLQDGDKQIELTQEWLQGHIAIPEIANKWAAGPIVKIRIEAPPSVAPGHNLPLRVVLTSNKVGHDFPTGPLDIIQSWVEIHVRDDNGRDIFHSGVRDTRHFLQPGTFLFKAEPVDQYGNLIDRHNLWEMVGVRYRRSLFPGYSDTVEYNIMCPADVSQVRAKGTHDRQDFSVPIEHSAGRLHIQATLHYRKVDQFLLNYVMGEKSGVTAPVVDLSSADATVCVAAPGKENTCR